MFLKFKKSKPHIDQKIYKVKYQVWNLIRKKKRESYKTNVRDSRPEVFSKKGVLRYGEAMRSCNKKMILLFYKSKLGMQRLLYVGPGTWNKFPNNLKTATSVNCFKHDVEKYFLKKLTDTEVDIYNYV